MTRLADSDAIFQALSDSYCQLDADGVARFHTRLILLLIAEIGDDATIHEIIRQAATPRASAQ